MMAPEAEPATAASAATANMVCIFVISVSFSSSERAGPSIQKQQKVGVDKASVCELTSAWCVAPPQYWFSNILNPNQALVKEALNICARGFAQKVRGSGLRPR